MTSPGERALSEEQLAELVEQIAERMRTGNASEAERLIAAHPDQSAQLREYLSAIRWMVEAASGDGGSGPASGELSGIDELPPNRVLGDFQILREIGRGGMGVVFEARQISLQRRVALKVLPMASLLDDRQILRFQNEARAAACLHHTHIVPVFAVGCERGVHFYAMQYIEGQTLADVIRQLRQEAGLDPKPAPVASGATATPGQSHDAPTVLSPRRGIPASDPVEIRHAPAQETIAVAGLSTVRPGRGTAWYRSVAELGAQIAEALDYAHSVGVVHRDIKPANLLLDARGQVWITDFGLAQLEADAGLTMTGDILGTLRYMSPEQALGQRGVLDHRTDVYSMGITLYELLTSRPAFSDQNRAQLVRAVIEQDPTAPRRLDPALPVDLELIVLKAVAKEQEHRYQTAGEIADDLRRFLSNQPIRAKRPSPLDHVRKWVRRHSGLVGIAAMTASILTAGLAIGLVILSRQESAKNDALNSAKGNLKLAEENSEKALNAVDGMLEVLRDPTFTRLPENRKFQELAAARALELYKSGVRENRPEETMRLQTAKAYRRMVSPLQTLSRKAEAKGAAQKAIAILEDLTRKSPDVPEYHEELAAAWCAFAGETSFEATEINGRAIAVWEHLYQKYPGNPKYEAELSRCLGLVTGWAKNIEYTKRALDLHLAMYQKEPGNQNRYLQYARSRCLYGACLTMLQREQEGISELEAGITALLQLHKHVPEEASGSLMDSLPRLAETLHRVGRAKDADAWKARVRTTFEAWKPANSIESALRAESLGRLQSEANLDREAIRTFSEELRACRDEIDRQGSKLAGDRLLTLERILSSGLEQALERASDLDGRVRVRKEQIARVRQYQEQKLLGADYGHECLQLEWSLGQELREHKRFEESRALLETALADSRKTIDMWAERSRQEQTGLEAYVEDESKLEMELIFTLDELRQDPQLIGLLELRIKRLNAYAGKPDFSRDYVTERLTTETLLADVLDRTQHDRAIQVFQKVMAESEQLVSERKHRWEASNRPRGRSRQGPDVSGIALPAVSEQVDENAERRYMDASKVRFEAAHRFALSFWRAGRLEDAKRVTLGLTREITAFDAGSQSMNERQRLVEARLLLAELHWDLGERREALPEIDRATELARWKDERRWTSFGVNPIIMPPKSLSDVAKVCARLGLHELEVSLLEEAVAHPRFKAALVGQEPINDLAWRLATAPDPALWNIPKAVELGRQAVASKSAPAAYWNTLGVALWRAGDSQGCLDALSKSCARNSGGTAHDWFFIALAKHQLGDETEARRWFRKALVWMNQRAPGDDELLRFRAEAECLIGHPADSGEPEPKSLPDASPPSVRRQSSGARHQPQNPTFFTKTLPEGVTAPESLVSLS